jgi:signal transduction histidine kinase
MPALRASVNAETTRNKVFLVRGRGEPQWISISAAPLFVSGIHTGGVVSISDITDRKQAEEALKKSENDLKILNENLESIVIQRTEQVRALSTALTFAEQRERKRFSYVLHEALQQKLFGAKMVLSQFVREHEKTGEFIGIDELNDGVRIIDKALQLTKTLSLELNPPILQTQGLDTALEWLGQHMRMNYGLNVAIEINGPINQVRGDIQMLLTQMVRELLNNVVKHSGVLKAVVRATCESNVIKITIKDEGRGFDMKTMEGKVTDETKFGLFSVSQRLKLLGGELIIDSKIGHGTQSTITCPVCNL